MPDERLSPARARDIVRARLATAGIELRPDAPVRAGAVELAVDGYDPARRIGYLYVPRDGGDTGERAAGALAELAAAGKAHVLIVREEDVPTEEVLERHIDGFFATLRRK